VFFGTPEWAVPSLEALIGAGIDVAAVVTNPDRPAGRGLDVTASPVKVAAQRAGLDVQQPESARAPEVAKWLQSIAADVAVVVAYGKILPQLLLDAVPHGFVNLHFSLLPAYRGAAPVQRAIMDGLDRTGVTVMILTAGMDEGPVVDRAEVRIEDDDTAGTLGARMADVGAPLLVETLPRYVSGELTPIDQDHSVATYAPKVTPDEARIDWTQGSRRVRDFVRALNPTPGAWTELRGRRLKVHRVEDASGGEDGLGPGTLRAVDDLLVGTGDGAVALVDVQPAGKRRMTGAELARGLRPEPGEHLE
jgi:methionyl-tRNA formyltransferase